MGQCMYLNSFWRTNTGEPSFRSHDACRNNYKRSKALFSVSCGHHHLRMILEDRIDSSEMRSHPQVNQLSRLDGWKRQMTCTIHLPLYPLYPSTVPTPSYPFSKKLHNQFCTFVNQFCTFVDQFCTFVDQLFGYSGWGTVVGYSGAVQGVQWDGTSGTVLQCRGYSGTVQRVQWYSAGGIVVQQGGCGGMV